MGQKAETNHLILNVNLKQYKMKEQHIRKDKVLEYGQKVFDIFLNSDLTPYEFLKILIMAVASTQEGIREQLNQKAPLN